MAPVLLLPVFCIIKRERFFKMKNILIVEDHEEMQILYGAFLKKEKDLNIQHQAKSGEEALEALKKYRPDLIIVDITLPEMSGIEFTRRAKKIFPHSKILVVSGYDTDLNLSKAMEAGADKLITKGDISRIIEEAKKLLFGD
ncbi:two-component response regulator [Chitinispirillum alkaliphilum]|nr:two-component response regulator [Chitinispirillum alkaliphilum]